MPRGSTTPLLAAGLLTEKAFQQCNVPYDEYSTDDSYQDLKNSEAFPIYKIHGSAEKALLAIDIAQQKLQGLSIEKKHILRKIFLENHLLFMGFSGEDFLFGSDYIPVRANKENNFGITCISQLHFVRLHLKKTAHSWKDHILGNGHVQVSALNYWIYLSNMRRQKRLRLL